MAFPTLKYSKITETIEDNAIISKPQDGKIITRKRYTKTRKSFTLNTSLMPLSYVTAMKAFYNTNETVLSFAWTHPNTAVVYTVRFSEPIQYDENHSTPDLYIINPIKLMEV